MSVDYRSCADELTKIATAQEAIAAGVKKYLPGKRLATFGAGVGATILGKQAFEDWSLGRRIRKQQRR